MGCLYCTWVHWGSHGWGHRLLGEVARELFGGEPQGERRVQAHRFHGRVPEAEWAGRSHRADHSGHQGKNSAVRVAVWPAGQKQTELEDQVRGQQWVWKTTDKGEEDRTVHLVVEEFLD